MLILAMRFAERVRHLITDWQVFYSKSEDGFFTNYSWYHILWLVLMLAGCIILCLTLAKKHDKKINDQVVFYFGLFLFAIELYKQIFNTLLAGHYQWYIFPFQFCSTPMYVALIAPFVKNEKIKNALLMFLSFYGLAAGLAVMAYPDSCFHTHYLTILLHTMLWHSSMVIIGVYLIVAMDLCTKVKNIFKEAVPGGIVFDSIVTFAVIANLLGYKFYFGNPELNVHDDTFFLMYLSPYYSCPFPILSTIKENQPYLVFLFCYLLAFFLGICIIWFLSFGIKKCVVGIIKDVESHKKTDKKTFTH